MYSRKEVPKVGRTSNSVIAVQAGLSTAQFPNSSSWKMTSLMLSTTLRYLNSLMPRASSERFLSMQRAMPCATEPSSRAIWSVKGCWVNIDITHELFLENQRVGDVGNQARAI